MPAIPSPLPYRFAFRPALLLALLAVVLSASARELNFTLPDSDNRPVRLADFRGKWVVVNFWATWCPPCLLELPELQAFYEAHRNRVAVIGVNFENLTPPEIRPYTERLAVTFPIVLSGGKPVPGFDLKGLPTTFLVSPAGELADAHLGTVTAAILTGRLAELDKAGEPPR
jgi:thiol-disulfide isomerase/thioredoxin